MFYAALGNQRTQLIVGLEFWVELIVDSACTLWRLESGRNETASKLWSVWDYTLSVFSYFHLQQLLSGPFQVFHYADYSQSFWFSMLPQHLCCQAILGFSFYEMLVPPRKRAQSLPSPSSHEFPQVFCLFHFPCLANCHSVSPKLLKCLLPRQMWWSIAHWEFAWQSLRIYGN